VSEGNGPLAGLKVIEMVGLGAGPFAAMMLADMGADVIRVDQPARSGAGAYSALNTRFDVLARNRRSIVIDLKKTAGLETLLRLVDRSDVLIEGFRPGVMERLGAGPQVCLARNPRLVFGRITGWGQEGPLARAAGHDIDYIALSGALGAMGPSGQPPVPPLNLVGDFGGGGMLLAFGVACALIEARRSGSGQVIDAAMLDGSSLMMAMFHGLRAAGLWSGRRGANLLDGGAHFYGTYLCADGGYIAIGPLEPQFYERLLDACGLTDPELKQQMNAQNWPALRARLEQVFATRSRGHWCSLLEGTDACFAPVLDLDEAPAHPHNVARNAFVEVAGVVQPAPAPRFSRTPAGHPTAPPASGEHTDEILRDWNFSAADIDRLVHGGIVATGLERLRPKEDQ